MHEIKAMRLRQLQELEQIIAGLDDGDRAAVEKARSLLGTVAKHATPHVLAEVLRGVNESAPPLAYLPHTRDLTAENHNVRLPCGDLADKCFGHCAMARNCEYANECPVS